MVRSLVKKIKKTPFANLSLIKNCTFGPLNEPVAKVKQGETIEVETWDCFSNVVRAGQTLKDVFDKGSAIYDNPITGPIYIEGAKPGDTLIVEVIDIKLPDRGVTALIPGFGGLEGWLRRSRPITKFSEIRNGRVIYTLKDGSKKEIHVEPFIGTIGVSPAFEAISTVTPGSHGGNMDVADVCPGNKLYVPVAVDGALFGLGDVHAVQGDCEICGTAIEIPSVVTLKLDLMKNKKINWPRIVSPDEIMTVCSSKPLEDAVRLGFLEMIKWLEEEYGFDRYDAYLFLSVVAKVRLAQIVDPLFTAVVKLTKKLLQK